MWRLLLNRKRRFLLHYYNMPAALRGEVSSAFGSCSSASLEYRLSPSDKGSPPGFFLESPRGGPPLLAYLVTDGGDGLRRGAGAALYIHIYPHGPCRSQRSLITSSFRCVL